MVAMNKRFDVYEEQDDYDELQAWSDDFDSSQHLRDLFFWSGLSLAIGIFIGMAIMSIR